MKRVIWANVMLQIVYFVCVTALVLHFDKPSLCWWYLLVFLLGWELKIEKKNGKEED